MWAEKARLTLLFLESLPKAIPFSHGTYPQSQTARREENQKGWADYTSKPFVVCCDFIFRKTGFPSP